MANSIGNLNVSIFGDTALQRLEGIFPGANIFATNLSDTSTPYGENSSITVKTFANAGTGLYGGSYTNTAATSSDVVVTLNQHRYAQRSLSVAELSSPYAPIMLQQIGEESGFAIASQMMTDLVSLLSGSNFPNSTLVTSASFNRNILNNTKAILGSRGVAQNNRVVVLNNNYYATLGNDTSLYSPIASNPYFTEAIATGKLPEIAGFMPYEAANSFFPTTAYASGSAAVPVGFACHKSAIAFASRGIPIIPQEYNPAQVSVSVNPKLGLALTNTMVYDPYTTGNLIFRTELVYGFTVGVPSALQTFVSSTG